MFVLWATCLLHPCIGFTTHFLTVTMTSSQIILDWGGRRALCPLGFTIRYNSNYALILFLIPPITFIGFKPSTCVLQVLINLYMTFFLYTYKPISGHLYIWLTVYRRHWWTISSTFCSPVYSRPNLTLPGESGQLWWHWHRSFWEYSVYKLADNEVGASVVIIIMIILIIIIMIIVIVAVAAVAAIAAVAAAAVVIIVINSNNSNNKSGYI